MTRFSLYNFDGFDVRIKDVSGNPWFAAKDVCKVLGISKYRDAVTRLDPDETAPVVLDTLGGPQEMTVINESGFYSLVLTSRKPNARKFKKWVTSEVLPTIRKTGSYDSTLIKALTDSTKALNTSTKAVIQLSAENKDLQREKTVLQERTETLEQEANENRPQLEAFKRLAGSKGTFSLTEAAKALKAPPRAFNKWMAAHGWIYQRSSQQSWPGYQTKVNSQLLTHKVTELPPNLRHCADSDPSSGDTSGHDQIGLAPGEKPHHLKRGLRAPLSQQGQDPLHFGLHGPIYGTINLAGSIFVMKSLRAFNVC